MTSPNATKDVRAHMTAICSMRIGMAGYAAILGSIRHCALSTTQLAEKHGVSRLLILGVMRHCLRAGIVHRTDWHRPAPHSRMVPRWALGADGDVSMPMYEERTRRPRRAPSTLILLTTALQLMEEHPHSRTELAAELCMHVETVYRIVDALRKNGLIYVASWHKPPIGTPVQEFAAGCKRDAPRPARVSGSVEVMRGYRQRQEQRAILHALAGSVARPMRAAA